MDVLTLWRRFAKMEIKMDKRYFALSGNFYCFHVDSCLFKRGESIYKSLLHQITSCVRTDRGNGVVEQKLGRHEPMGRG